MSNAVPSQGQPAERANRWAIAASTFGFFTLVLAGGFWALMLKESGNCTGCRDLLTPAAAGGAATLLLFVGPTLLFTRLASRPASPGGPARRGGKRAVFAVLCVSVVLLVMGLASVRILF